MSLTLSAQAGRPSARRGSTVHMWQKASEILRWPSGTGGDAALAPFLDTQAWQEGEAARAHTLFQSDAGDVGWNACDTVTLNARRSASGL